MVRIQSILRRYEKNTTKEESSSILHFENIKVDTEKTLVEIDGKIINFTKNEYDILKKVLEYNGKLVSREILMKEVIGYENYMYDRTIDTHVKNIRKKIGNPELILTVRGK